MRCRLRGMPSGSTATRGKYDPPPHPSRATLRPVDGSRSVRVVHELPPSLEARPMKVYRYAPGIGWIYCHDSLADVDALRAAGWLIEIAP